MNGQLNLSSMEIEELKKMDMITLVDLLAKKTTDYMSILKSGGPEEEFRKCKELIKLLTKEIQDRKNEALKE
jgi:hypothetical protein